jgi:hypothetical protein
LQFHSLILGQFHHAYGGRDETDQERTGGAAKAANARKRRADSARRARLILLLAEGFTWAEIRAKLDCSDSYIDRWSKRFAADRLSGCLLAMLGASAT